MRVACGFRFVRNEVVRTSAQSARSNRTFPEKRSYLHGGKRSLERVTAILQLYMSAIQKDCIISDFFGLSISDKSEMLAGNDSRCRNSRRASFTFLRETSFGTKASREIWRALKVKAGKWSYRGCSIQSRTSRVQIDSSRSLLPAVCHTILIPFL